MERTAADGELLGQVIGYHHKVLLESPDGAGQARNRTARAVERTVPFQLACQAIAACWYASMVHS